MTEIVSRIQMNKFLKAIMQQKEMIKSELVPSQRGHPHNVYMFEAAVREEWDDPSASL